jgi:hypothetical protein
VVGRAPAGPAAPLRQHSAPEVLLGSVIPAALVSRALALRQSRRAQSYAALDAFLLEHRLCRPGLDDPDVNAMARTSSRPG